MNTPDATDIRLDPQEVRVAPPRRSRFLPIFAGIVLGLGTVAGWVWWSQPPGPFVSSGVPPDRPAAVRPPAVESESAVQYPVNPAAPLQAREIPSALTQLLGSAAARHLQTDDFPRRFVATVDNLARSHSPVLMWPVAPAPGRFTVEDGPDGSKIIASANAQRYANFVAFAASVDAAAAVRLYGRMYPVLQQAYRQLGFGERYLNDRVVQVIDHLLATPEPAGPLQVTLTEVKGPVASTRPWVRYEFVDPNLKQMSAGQKILLRVGLANERRLKQKLAQLREQLVQSPPTSAAR